MRIALNLKGLTREDIAINLDSSDQFKPEYKAQNPQAVVPTLYDGNAKLFQSVAILEYLEPFKRAMRICDACMAIPAFAEAHSHKQPDFEGHLSRLDNGERPHQADAGALGAVSTASIST